jgi:hypothetical protein
MVNGSFSAGIDNGFSSLFGWSNQAGTSLTAGTAGIAYDSAGIFGPMNGGKLQVFTPTLPADPNYVEQAWAAVPVSAGASGMILSFDLLVSGGNVSSTASPTPLTIEVRVAQALASGISGVAAPKNSVSVSTFTENYSGKALYDKAGHLINPNGGLAVILHREYHIDLLGKAPHYEWNVLNKATPSAWVGFYCHPGTGTEDKNYYIQNVRVDTVPSTIYGFGNLSSTTAAITAWFDSSISSQLTVANRTATGFLDFYSRPKNFEIDPHLPKRVMWIFQDDASALPIF